MNNTRRFNPLTSEWVIVASNRINRPWKGAQLEEEPTAKTNGNNSLAPRGTRLSGAVNDDYSTTFVFENDFPSFTAFEASRKVEEGDEGLFVEQEVRGTCRVICYHPDSEKTLALMTKSEVMRVLEVWREQFAELQTRFEWIQVFENRGEAVGCSNQHPHGQLWASNYLPTIVAKKDENQKKYYETKAGVMLMDYLEKELVKDQRIVASNEHWVVLVPFWAFWPFETMILPRRHVLRYLDLNGVELEALAEILQTLLIKYDNVFKCSFPYMMGLLGAPTGKYLDLDCTHWQFHVSFYPPLLRSSKVVKHVAGYEVFAEKQRDTLPEEAARILRAVSDTHYSIKDTGSRC